ncbi:MAG: SDR family oxidoreductase, partial [Rhodospirillales bacterium]|nr:SDR family oxidoreductase [Rhodospirillales bacterium]
MSTLFARVEDRCGKLDVLLNAAAIVPFVPWDALIFEEWRRVLRMNLDSLFLMCRAASDLMRKSGYGRSINIASNSLHAGTPNMGHYVASKGSMLSLHLRPRDGAGMPGHHSQLCGAGSDRHRATQSSPHKEAFGFVEMPAGGSGGRAAAARCPGHSVPSLGGGPLGSGRTRPGCAGRRASATHMGGLIGRLGPLMRKANPAANRSRPRSSSDRGCGCCGRRS